MVTFMVIFQTKMQKAFAKRPSELAFKRMVFQRGIDRSKNILDTIRRLEAGERGEELLVQKLVAFGQPDWTIIRNLRLKDYATFEMDVVLITRNCVYVFEVKNYTGRFEFREGDSFFNGLELNSNVVQQTRNALLNMQTICGKYARNIRVQGILVFIGENNQVSIQSDTGNIRILQLTDLYTFVKEIVAEESAYAFPSFDTLRLIAHLERYETENVYGSTPLSAEELGKAQCGIYCARCSSYEIKISKRYVKCVCGLHEPREEAMVRTICEYGVLTYDRNFTKGEILAFIGRDASHTYVAKILSKHFNPVDKNRYTYYTNYKLPYYMLSHLFEIKEPVIFYSKRGLPEIYRLE